MHHFQSITGFGAKAHITDSMYYVGNSALLKDNNISIAPQLESSVTKWLTEAKSVIYFADEKQALAVVAIADKIKDTSVQAVQQLQAAGIDVYMLTGDNQATAKAIAAQVGISHYKAEVLPAHKADFVKE